MKEDNTPQLAIENTHSAVPIKKEQFHPGVIYDTSLENTLSIMKKNIGFFIIEQRDNGINIWNEFPVEKMGGKNLKIMRNFLI